MIRWITDSLGTASRFLVNNEHGIKIIDVRDLVDKRGNSAAVIKKKIDEALAYLSLNKKVVVCCDYGISRSNAVAAGILSLIRAEPFDAAVRRVITATGEKNIKIEVLSAVRASLQLDQKDASRILSGSQRHILVTGGSGFIGSSLIRILSSRHDIVAPGHEQINLADGSVELDLLVKDKGVNCIVHLANPRIYNSNLAMGETLVILRNVLDVCRENAARLVYLSGWEVYSGYREGSLLASESLPLRPQAPYGETKYLCEKLIEQHHYQYGLEYTMLRSSPVYGKGGNKPKFIYSFIHKAKSNEEIVTHRYLNGDPILDLLYVDDLVAAILSAIERDFIGIVNIGFGKGISTAEVARLIVESLGSRSSIQHNEIQDFVANIIMDISKATTTLDWEPKIGVTEGIQTLLSYPEQGRTAHF